jgi:hypothetical protein
MATQSTTLHVKLYLNNNQEIRRFNLQPKTTPWSDFVKLVTSLFQLKPEEKLNISYLDEENDKVRLDTEGEWEHALCLFSQQKLSKIFIQTNVKGDSGNPDQNSETMHRKYREGCRFRFQNLVQQQDVSKRAVFWKEMCRRQSPFNQQERTSKTNSESPYFCGRRLHFRAYQALVEKKYEQARELYLELLKRNPQDNLALYNLGCCEALCESPDLALYYLFLAVENGYDRYEHMRQDQDLVSLRDDPTFLSILESLSKKQTEVKINLDY